MKQITLIRHAKVALSDDEKMDSKAFKYWVAMYDVAEIDSDSRPDQDVIDKVKRADIIMTSRLKRSIDSVKVLGSTPDEMDALFDEATVPDAPIPLLRLRPKRWLQILRVLLLLRLGKDDNSLKASKERAKKAADRLVALSKSHDEVVLVGHGGMNWLIRKELLASDWILKEKPSNAHWGMTVLEQL